MVIDPFLIYICKGTVPYSGMSIGAAADPSL